MTSMREAQYTSYGPPDVLSVNTVPIPHPGPGEVLVKVTAASVGGGEMPIRAGRMRHLMRSSRPFRVGNDFSGTIVAVGTGSERFSIGDAVWGLTAPRTFGSTADYVCVAEALVAQAPTSIDLLHAAALPSAGTTAVSALDDHARLQPGERILIRGASGGVGALVVQLAKTKGAHVTAMAGADNLDWLSRIGADDAVDYRESSVSTLGTFDVIVDLVGTDLRAYRRLLSRRGRLVILAMDPKHLVRSIVYVLWGVTFGRKHIRAFSNHPTAEQIGQLARLVDAGSLQPVVQEVFTIDDIAAAHQRQEAGGIRGKLLIAIDGR
jgi:NADPH:quinone reductase-like Zn-dependent oxidoreductase